MASGQIIRLENQLDIVNKRVDALQEEVSLMFQKIERLNDESSKKRTNTVVKNDRK